MVLLLAIIMCFEHSIASEFGALQICLLLFNMSLSMISKYDLVKTDYVITIITNITNFNLTLNFVFNLIPVQFIFIVIYCLCNSTYTFMKYCCLSMFCVGYKGYIHPGITHEFQSAAMRFGHTLVPPGVMRRFVCS